jgi:dTDP-glucose pyrophosphorylase
MRSYSEHLVPADTSIKSALKKLDSLAIDAILFVVDTEGRLIGSITDGDIRRGLLKDVTLDQRAESVCNMNPKFVSKGEFYFEEILSYRKDNITIIPIVNEERQVVNVINFRHLRSYLPIDAVVMAGGRGSRLRPLTDSTPKPLLKVGDKPIVEHNIDRLSLYGIDDFWLSVNYLGAQIRDYFGNGSSKNISIGYVSEDEPLGTIGSLSMIKEFVHDYVLLTNSDILTNLDYEHFFMEFIASEADLTVVTIPYNVNIPYAVLETSEGGIIRDFKEKPTYTYFSNGGIYLMKKDIIGMIPKNTFYNATDLMAEMIKRGKKVTSYPLMGYWLDVGKHEDFKKAQEDIQHIKF